MEFQHDVTTFSVSENTDGSLHISYTGSCVMVPKIDFNMLIQIKEKADSNTEVFKEVLARNEQLSTAVDNLHNSLKTARSEVTLDYLDSHRGGWNKDGCGNRSDAEILAKAIHGATNEELLKGRYTYDRFGHKKVYSRGKIFQALSVKKPEDYERITSLYSAYPEVFDCTLEELFTWFKKRYEKGGNKQ